MKKKLKREVPEEEKIPEPGKGPDRIWIFLLKEPIFKLKMYIFKKNNTRRLYNLKIFI